MEWLLFIPWNHNLAPCQGRRSPVNERDSLIDAVARMVASATFESRLEGTRRP